MGIVTWEQVARGGSFRLGSALGAGAVVAVAALAFLPVSTWSPDHGFEWWNAIVLGSAAAVAVHGVLTARRPGLRRRGVGLVLGAPVGVVLVYAAFLLYFLGLHGS